ncbi:hypothetical protein CsSME_00049178 [Camellia sinensis var. sinensis]
MPINLHISIPKLKKLKPKSQHPPSHNTSPPTHKSPSSTIDRHQSYGHSTSTINRPIESPRGVLFDSPRLMFMADPPLRDLRGSHRFFVTTDGSSSLMEEARMSACSNAPTRQDSVAVALYSSEPCDEFYKSMVEMVASRLEQNLTVDWDYMQDLLICYLDINEKSSHKYVLRAFVDVVVGLRQISDEISTMLCKIPSPRSWRKRLVVV